MNKILPKCGILFVFFLGVAIFPLASVYAAASVQFTPSSISASQNATFEVNVAINVETNATLGSDAVLNFASRDLDVVSIKNGGFFPEFGSASNASSGRIEVHGYTSASNDSRTGSGTLATIVFKAKKGSGSSTISFTCTASGNDTNILTTTGQNILNCAQTNSAGVSFSGTTNTNTSTPTPTQGSSGSNTTPQCASLYSDVSSATGTPLSVTLTCSGIDTGGYINAAEFTFGDGTKQTVEKNAGSPGSIATTHTFTTIGTLGTSCRVRDNDGIWSSVSDNCKKNISIKPQTISSPPTQSYGDTGKIVTTPSPTTIVVSIVSETPTPIEEPVVEPTLYPENPEDESTQTSSNRVWWIIGGIVAILLAFLLLRRRDPPRDHQGQTPITNA